jgi:hypothetical protein
VLQNRRHKCFRKLRKIFSSKNCKHSNKLFIVTGRSPNDSGDRVSILKKIAIMSDDFCRRMFRMDRDSFQWLLALVRPIIDGKTSRSIAPDIKLAVALRFLAGAIY